jgi:hypothetical protein
MAKPTASGFSKEGPAGIEGRGASVVGAASTTAMSRKTECRQCG